MRRIVICILAAILFFGGFAVLAYPMIDGWLAEKRAEKVIARFEDENGQKTDRDREYEQRKEALRLEMETYNREIYENRQAGLKDAWSYEQNLFDLSVTGFEDHMIGYLSIEAMDVRLPLYIGANKNNMAKGATVLSETSMPVGGENTNCVIAAHRGYKGIAMFREIETLKEGDIVEITNPWDTLKYEVVKCIVITPDDIEAVKIVEGTDLVTLVTCHPYTKNYQRYVVYCRRKTGEAQLGNTTNLVLSDGVEYTPSEGDIRRERLLQLGGMVCFALLLVIFLLSGLAGRKSSRRKNKIRA